MEISAAQWMGTGTNSDPYRITSAADLKALSQYVNSGNSTKNVFFVVTADIDMAGVTDFIPIGGWSADGTQFNLSVFFQGTFNGNGKVIRNLSIQKKQDDQSAIRIGLFGYVVGDKDGNAVIKSLGIEKANLTGNKYVGSLCGEFSYATIDKVYATGNVTGQMVSGGLFGIGDNSKVTNSHANVDTSGSQYIGGFCGENSNQTTISNCYSSGCVSGDSYIGGFCGINGGSISECYFCGGAITGATDYVGGFCGKNSNGSIDKCYVGRTRILAHWYIGGFCGENYSAKISNSYTVAEVHSDDYSGEFCGKNDYLNTDISNCYCAGQLTVTEVKSDLTGGFCGEKTNGATIKNCYRLTPNGGKNSYGTAMSISNMQKPAFVKDLNGSQKQAPWLADFSNAAAINNALPILTFQKRVPDAPTIGTALAGNAQAKVTFTPPVNTGFSPVSQYTVVASPGGTMASGANSPIIVNNLNNGTSYSFTVTATNAVGPSPPSLASNSVTPAATAIATVKFTNAGDIPSQQVLVGDCATEPLSPHKKGYTFNGWYCTGETTKFDFNTPIEGDTELSASYFRPI